MNKFKIQDIVLIGMFTAIIAVSSQISIPLPSGIPLTLQTLSVSLTGFFLSRKNSIFSVITYLLIGFIGFPVFSGFKGGVGTLFGLTGGFLFGFIIMVFFLNFESENKILLFISCILGLLSMHLCGVIQFSLITGNTFIKSFLIVSLPYIPKDILSIILAKIISIRLEKRITNL